MGQIKIIGGFHRSRVIKFHDGVNGLRPTPSSMRERLFNWLEQDLTNKKCLDLFAGSGALGFEAISRNAENVVMVEVARDAIKDLNTNKNLLKADNLTIVNYPALKFLESTETKFDIIFVDPPYDSDQLTKTLKMLKIRQGNMLNPDSIIYIEYNEKPDLDGFDILKESKPAFVNAALIRVAEILPTHVNNN